MPKDLRDFMNKNNLASSRDSQARVPANEQQRINYDGGNNDGRYQSNNQQAKSSRFQGGGNSQVPNQNLKYQKSKNQCVEQLNRYLEAINISQGKMKGAIDTYCSDVIKKFSSDYDNLAESIIHTVETQLKNNKDKFLREIRQRRNAEFTETKPIRRNMEKLKGELISLRDGLHRENDYRQYISKIVLKDWEMDLEQIQQQIDRLRLPNVEVFLDEKYYNCFKNDLNRLIVVRDEFQLRSNNQQQPNFSSQSQNIAYNQPGYNNPQFNELNPHTNRDQIKRTQNNNKFP